MSSFFLSLLSYIFDVRFIQNYRDYEAYGKLWKQNVFGFNKMYFGHFTNKNQPSIVNIRENPSYGRTPVNAPLLAPICRMRYVPFSALVGIVQ